MATQMTVHAALSRLRTYEARINKAINELSPVAIRQNGRLSVNQSVGDFSRSVQGRWAQVNALIANSNKIKRAVTVSNALTQVVIAGVTMTVAEAIDYRKRQLNVKKQLLATMTSRMNVVNRAVEETNKNLQNRAESAANAYFASAEQKNTEEWTAFVNRFVEMNSAQIIDPIQIERQIAALDREIREFEAEVDTVLTASNVQTLIEIDLENED